MKFEMKKILFLFPLIFILCAVAASYWFYQNSLAVSNNKAFKSFVINKGASITQIANKLKKEGLIKNAFVFKVYIKFTGQAQKLVPGEFSLSSSLSLFQLTQILFKGPIELWVTIPEGLRKEEIALKFASVLGKDTVFTTEFLEATKDKEGYLFPDTYLFPKDVSVTNIVKKMTDTFNLSILGLKNTSGLSQKDIVVLASIIERETKTDAERPIVAGILLNRIKIGMPLQEDATVQYALASTKYTVLSTKADWWPTVYIEDLKIKSLYNTYLNQGFPPAPIANPGLSSLKAAFNPSETKFLYYIHDTSGQIHYAATLQEHNANVAKYIR